MAFRLHGVTESGKVFDNGCSECLQKYPDSLVSIAFGAPLICDEVAAKKINSNKEYKWRFINFVNKDDYVPHMLHNLSRTFKEVWKSALGRADSALQSLGGCAGRCVEGFVDGRALGALSVAGRETGQLAAKGIVHGAQTITSTLQGMCKKEFDPLDAPRNPDFHPIGQFISLSEGGSSQYQSGDLQIVELFDRDHEFKEEQMQHHQMDSYRNGLIATGFIDVPTGPGACVADPQSRLSSGNRSLVTSPPPMVSNPFFFLLGKVTRSPG